MSGMGGRCEPKGKNRLGALGTIAIVIGFSVWFMYQANYAAHLPSERE
jgi:hypothetical protein